MASDVARDPTLSANVGTPLLVRAKARLLINKEAAAIADLRAAEVSLRNGYGDDHPETLEARELLALRAGN
jgi:hypothetical protein